MNPGGALGNLCSGDLHFSTSFTVHGHFKDLTKFCMWVTTKFAGRLPFIPRQGVFGKDQIWVIKFMKLGIEVGNFLVI